MKTIRPKDHTFNSIGTRNPTTNYRRTELRRVIEEVAMIAKTPMALISLIDQSHARFAATLGIETQTTLGLQSICSRTVSHPGEPLVILDVRQDGIYQVSPICLGPTLVGFYVGIPLIDRAGYALGALCALDKVPRRIAPESSTLERLAQLAREAERLIAG